MILLIRLAKNTLAGISCKVLECPPTGSGGQLLFWLHLPLVNISSLVYCCNTIALLSTLPKHGQPKGSLPAKPKLQSAQQKRHARLPSRLISTHWRFGRDDFPGDLHRNFISS